MSEVARGALKVEVESHGAEIAFTSEPMGDANANANSESIAGFLETVPDGTTRVEVAPQTLAELFQNPEYEDPEVERFEADARRRLSGPGSGSWDLKLPQKLSYKHKFLCHLAALGLPRKEISDRTGYSMTWLTKLSQHKEFADEVDRVRKALFGSSADQILRIESRDNAIRVIGDVLRPESGEKSALRVETAFRVLDRTDGKPTQRVEHTGSLLKDLFAELDSQKSKPIDIAPSDYETHTIPMTGEGLMDEALTAKERANSTVPDPIAEFLKETYDAKEGTGGD